jgi:hypothetical protein
MIKAKIEVVEEFRGPSGEATLDQMWKALLNAQQFAAAKVGAPDVAPRPEVSAQDV